MQLRNKFEEIHLNPFQKDTLVWLIRLLAIYLFIEWTYNFLLFSSNIEPQSFTIKKVILSIVIGLILHAGIWGSTTKLGQKHPWLTLLLMSFMFGFSALCLIDKFMISDFIGVLAPLLGAYVLFAKKGGNKHV